MIKAIHYENIDVAKLLIENDADVNIVDNESKTALMIALQKTMEEVAIFLVLYGADLNVKIKGESPIEFADTKLQVALQEIHKVISGREEEVELYRKNEDSYVDYDREDDEGEFDDDEEQSEGDPKLNFK